VLGPPTNDKGSSAIFPLIAAAVFPKNIEKSTVMDFRNLFSYLFTPFHSYPKKAPSIAVIGFESGKKRGLMEKLFPFFARGWRRSKLKNNEKQHVTV